MWKQPANAQSSTPRLRQIKLRAAASLSASLGQSAVVFCWPYRPCSPHRYEKPPEFETLLNEITSGLELKRLPSVLKPKESRKTFARGGLMHELRHRSGRRTSIVGGVLLLPLGAQAVGALQ